MSTEKSNKYAVPALDKGLDILEYLASKAVPLSQTEIAQGIERSSNEIYRVLVGLESRGYLIRDEISGKYSVSLKLYSLSRKISPIDQLRQTAIPIMEDFSAQSGYAAHLSILYQSKVMVIIHARSQSALSLSIAEGTLFPTTDTTSGLVLLANSNEQVKQLIYDRDKSYSQMNKKTKAELEHTLEDILRNGYCFRENKLTTGVSDCATIIGQPKGAVIAALTVSSLTSAIKDEEEKQQLIQSLKETAILITKQLGY
ncbi:IclR family transcriptional regulator [Colwellia sp. E2M01]|uniref:IclR family transcriptional regulator n=1 Tax=Colwellia sp. E2M01 TaxID=2841561 RepID=UPI001C09868C|nr:IclR family transcriptional regulator [Colwellia sp. E2M01]MBU2871586.1 IclR family transcriptional regulator [Colwellia sp. E2M01]